MESYEGLQKRISNECLVKATKEIESLYNELREKYLRFNELGVEERSKTISTMDSFKQRLIKSLHFKYMREIEKKAEKCAIDSIKQQLNQLKESLK